MTHAQLGGFGNLDPKVEKGGTLVHKSRQEA